MHNWGRGCFEWQLATSCLLGLTSANTSRLISTSQRQTLVFGINERPRQLVNDPTCYLTANVTYRKVFWLFGVNKGWRVMQINSTSLPSFDKSCKIAKTTLSFILTPMGDITPTLSSQRLAHRQSRDWLTVLELRLGGRPAVGAGSHCGGRCLDDQGKNLGWLV